MADVMTREQRSRCMSRIRGKDTRPEMLVRRGLWHRGLRFRIKSRVPGRPDIVFPSEHVAVFVDGCFWHSCPEHGAKPSTNAVFWRKKLLGNVERDRRTEQLLRADGWVVLRFWEHDVDRKLESVVDRIHRRVVQRRTTLGARKAAADRRLVPERRASRTPSR